MPLLGELLNEGASNWRAAHRGEPRPGMARRMVRPARDEAFMASTVILIDRFVFD